MRNLLSFLLKYNNLFVFILLQSIAFYLLTTGNNYHNSRVVKGIQGVTAGMEKRISNVRSYLSLTDINTRLASENSNLRNRIEQLTKQKDQDFLQVNDTVSGQQFKYISARVINNSVNKQKNYITIDKGSRQGIRTDMALTDGSNVAGVIIGCSENFAVAISLLNLDFRLSARIRDNGYYGSLSWDGRNYRFAVLNEIPQHININVGDTIETTGYSSVFPEGVSIGTISELKRSGSDFYNIKIELFTDFKKLQYVNVIGNLKRSEQLKLENTIK